MKNYLKSHFTSYSYKLFCTINKPKRILLLKLRDEHKIYTNTRQIYLRGLIMLFIQLAQKL